MDRVLPQHHRGIVESECSVATALRCGRDPSTLRFFSAALVVCGRREQRRGFNGRRKRTLQQQYSCCELLTMHDQEESEIDVVALSPAPSQSSCNSTQTEKKYFCQRCLNHDLQFPRKGHKPMCKYASCTCSDCIMVEQRRQLNNMLSKSKQLTESPRETVNGRRIRDPQCARCRQHGIRVPLRGHKRVLCQFANCKCEMCELVEDRRSLMAKQIKLRRDQQRQRNSMDDRHSSDSIGENDMVEASSVEIPPSPLVVLPHPVAVYPCTATAAFTPPLVTTGLPIMLPAVPSVMSPSMSSSFLLPLPFFNIFHQLTAQQQH